MKYRIELTDQQEEDIVIYAKRQSAVLEKIEALLQDSSDGVLGYSESDIVKLDAKSICCFFSEGGRVYAENNEGRWQIKERLYQLEQTYSSLFVKINQSCLVNASKIKKFSSSIGGALLVVLENGHKDYVSRRQMKAVKERKGF